MMARSFRGALLRKRDDLLKRAEEMSMGWSRVDSALRGCRALDAARSRAEDGDPEHVQ
jgi:hypothetical protein